MKTIEEILAQIPDQSEREQLINIIQIIEDPLSRDILGKLASPHSPIIANKMPTTLLTQSKISILSRLKTLVDMKLVESTFETSEDGMSYKKYEITNNGKHFATQHAKFEVEKHSQLLSKTP
jgi:predicted transcriptional regulator